MSESTEAASVEHRLMRTESQVGAFSGLVLNSRWVCSCGQQGRWVQNARVRASHKAHATKQAKGSSSESGEDR